MRNVTAVLTLMLAACADAALDPTAEAALAGGPFAQVELDLTLGSQLLSVPDTVPVTVGEVLPMEDGTVWILVREEDEARIRRFDPAGRSIGQVGAPGFQPGEYIDPRSLTRLPGGGVMVVDPALTGRITLFDSDGSLTAVPRSQDSTVWHDNGMAQVDDQGRLWLLTKEGMVPPRSRMPAFFTVAGLDAVTVDTVHLPEFPEVEQRQLQVPAFSGPRTFRLPWEPILSWTLGPQGRFVFVRGGRYEVLRFGPPEGDRSATEVIAERTLAPIPINQAERRQRRDQMRARLDTMRFGEEVEIPELAETKPPVLGLRYASDGRLLVKVSLPSRQEGALWVEPNGWDVFDRGGSFVARIVLPHDVEVHDLEGDHIWGVRTDTSGRQSVVRYRLTWPARAAGTRPQPPGGPSSSSTS